jgi:hypothetical protein
MSTDNTQIEKGKADDKSPAQPKKRPAIPTFWVALRNARRVFNVQLNKTNIAKLQCICNQISSIPDQEKFWSEYLNHVDRLLDSRKYLRECETLNVSAENLAEHLVFSGNAEINKVLRNGVTNTLHNNLKFYVDRLVSPETIGFFRSEKSSVIAG